MLLLAGVFLCLTNMLLANEIKTDENIQFYPDTARALDNGTVEARIQAWVYEPERRPGVSTLLAKYLGLDLNALSKEEHDLFMQRTQLFRVDSHSGKSLQVVFAKQVPITLVKTSVTGRTHALLIINNVIAMPNKAQWLLYHARLPKGDARNIEGRVLLLPERGISVVSDIDDTIKISEVLDRKKLLLNTFAKPFLAVPGTAERYREIAKQPGSAFHYVSGSPHHLYPALQQFLRDANFPDGTLHLRDMNWRQELFRRDDASKLHKLAVIRQLMRDFPKRSFIFFGDSGEHDPEIYGQLAREFPEQVKEIHIRNVTDQSQKNPRYLEAFRGVPVQRWSVSTE
jgi:phosphatidate phosphatase APP1